jgi:hypothetical protein
MTVPFPPRRIAVFAGLCWLAAVLSAHADTVTLFPSADCTLIELRPSNSIGAATWFSAGTTQNGNSNRALLKFDVAAAVPAGSIITDVGLKIWVTRTPVDGNADSSFSLRRVLRPWAEGANPGPDTNPGYGLPALPGDATWSHCFWGTNEWSIPGGQEGVDFSSEFSATKYIAGIDAEGYFFESGGTIGDVQLWLDHPESNFGWMLKTEEEESIFTARRFGSRELEDPFESPQLTITFLLPLAITNVHVMSNRLALTFNADVGYFYRVESSSAAAGTNIWTTLTNFGLVLSSGPRTVTDAITNAHRFYRVRRN